MNRWLTTLRPEFLPDLSCFWKIAQCDLVVLTDHLQYVKRSSITVSAPLRSSNDRLRIPVLHKGQVSISEKEMDLGHNWKKKHLSLLHHLFGDSPFGYYYLPLIKEMYDSENRLLIDFLYHLLQSIVSWLHFDCEIVLSSKLFKTEPGQPVVYLANKLNADSYLADIEVYTRGWVSRIKLKQNSIKTFEFEKLSEAHILQSNKGLSILAFLMQYGPEAGYLLRQFLPTRK